MNIFNVIALVLTFYMIYKFSKFVWMKWFDGTLMYYAVKPMLRPDESSTPFEFVHNGKEYKVFVTHEDIKNVMLGTMLSRSSVYIDGRLVLMISRMRETAFIRRSVDVDLQYANTDIFKILKWARLHWRERFSEEYRKHKEGINLIQS